MSDDIPALIAELRLVRPGVSPAADRENRAADALEAQAQRITELQAEAVDLRKWWGRSVRFGAQRTVDYDEALLRAQRAEAERDEFKRLFSECHPIHLDGVQRARKAEAECDALAAVIEEVRSTLRAYPNYGARTAVDHILSGSPSGALDRVKAEALREAADEPCSTPGCHLGRNHGGDRCNTFDPDGHP